MRCEVKRGIKDWNNYGLVIQLADEQRGFSKKDAGDFFYGISCLMEEESNKGKFRNYFIRREIGKYYLVYQANKELVNDLFGNILEGSVVKFEFSRTICPRLLELKAEVVDKNPKFRKDLDYFMRLIGDFKIKKKTENPNQRSFDFS